MNKSTLTNDNERLKKESCQAKKIDSKSELRLKRVVISKTSKSVSTMV